MIPFPGWTRGHRIEFTGLRPAKNFYEELLSDRESTLPRRTPSCASPERAEAPGETWSPRSKLALAGALSGRRKRSNGTREESARYASAAAEGSRGIAGKGM